jgi:hypothetical protein
VKCSTCYGDVKPVVALDIDGTLGDYHGSLLDFAERWLGLTGTGWSLTYDGSMRLAEFMGLDDHTYRQIKLAYRQGGGKRMMPVYGGAAMLTHFLRDTGAEVWMTTTRPYNRFDSTDPDTRFWLDHNGFQWDHLLYDDDKYMRLIEAVDPERVVGILDDDPKQYDRAVELGLPVTLRKTRYNAAIQRSNETSTLSQAWELLRPSIESWGK